MNKYFSFILSTLGVFLALALVFYMFDYRIRYEFKNTFLVYIEPKNNLPKQDITVSPSEENLNQNLIEKITPKFLGDPSPKEEDIKEVKALFFGDTHFTRGFTYYIGKKERQESDYFRCFTGLNDNFLKTFDIVGVNLETSIAKKEECAVSTKSIIFRTEPTYAERFKELGFTHFNLANNHSYDCGFIGYDATKKYLESLDLRYFGEGRKGESVIHKEEIQGIKIAHIGMENVEVKVDIPEKIGKIQKLSQEGYFIIVNIHFGAEYQKKHSTTQENIAHKLVDAGADIIIGHHPHVVQDFEVYKGAPIYYSLGNFIFDQPFPETLEGMGVALRFNQEKVIEHKTLSFQRDKKYYDIVDCSGFQNFNFSE